MSDRPKVLQKFSDEEMRELIQLTQTLVFDAIQWTPSIHGALQAEAYVYTIEGESAYIALMPLTDDTGYLLERLKLLLSGGGTRGETDN